jgi:hypothetical protein
MRKFALLLLLCPMPALADVAAGRPEFSWTQPTTWTNGDPLTTAQITGYQLVCTGAQAVDARLAATGPPATYPPTASPALPAGSYACTLAVYARQTPTSQEVLGAATNPVNFVVPQPRPTAATDFSVN